MRKTNAQWIAGIDEAGRGPLAGPVSVGVVRVLADFNWEQKLPGVTDSKQLSEKKREEVYEEARRSRASGELDYAVAMVGATVIDKKGIVFAINTAMRRAMKRLQLDSSDAFIQLDGSLHAPPAFAQETIIKGDASEPAIGLASIMAKVTRDRYMRGRAKLAAYTPYDFATHKGYGTKAHREAIAKYGLSLEHRVTYCKKIKRKV